MNGNMINRAVESSFHPARREVTIALSVLGLVAVLDIFVLAYGIGYLRGKEDVEILNSQVTASGFSIFHTVNAIRVAVAISLVIGIFGLWARRAAGYCLSVLALMATVGLYLWWYVESAAFLRNNEVSSYAELDAPNLQHSRVLVGATWWDIIVLIIVVAVLIWAAKIPAKLLGGRMRAI